MFYSFKGRCSLEVGKRHVDLTKVIWLGTSNIGHNLVFEHCDSRPDPSKPITREEYRDLMDLSRPPVSECLGVSAWTGQILYGLPDAVSSRHHFCLALPPCCLLFRSPWKKKWQSPLKRYILSLATLRRPWLLKMWRQLWWKHCQVMFHRRELARYTELCRTNWWIWSSLCASSIFLWFMVLNIVLLHLCIHGIFFRLFIQVCQVSEVTSYDSEERNWNPPKIFWQSVST